MEHGFYEKYCSVPFIQTLTPETKYIAPSPSPALVLLVYCKLPISTRVNSTTHYFTSIHNRTIRIGDKHLFHTNRVSTLLDQLRTRNQTN